MLDVRRYTRTVACSVSSVCVVYLFGFQAHFNVLNRQESVPVDATAISHSQALDRPASNTRKPDSNEAISTFRIAVGQEADEITNVRLAAARLDGVQIAAGADFSFNDTVGSRDAELGYMPGMVYENGEAKPGIGGGICIASTALYNAALLAGLKILERSPHSGPVSYAEPGRDSAVAYGSCDLRFRNATGSSVTLSTQVLDGKIVVGILGRRPVGREVEVKTSHFRVIPGETLTVHAPELRCNEQLVVQQPRDGYQCTIVRIIRENGKIVSREEISTDRLAPRDALVVSSASLSEPILQMLDSSLRQAPVEQTHASVAAPGLEQSETVEEDVQPTAAENKNDEQKVKPSENDLQNRSDTGVVHS